jgi:ribose transport system ATP-binding protein
MTGMADAARSPSLLEATGVVKAYGAVVALRDASLEVRPGEVHALLGANGAGKSTLVKVLTGAVRPDRGRIVLRGEEREVHSPAEARRTGLVSVYQEPSLIPDLDVASNLRLTETPLGPFMSLLPQLGVARLDPRQIVGDMPLAILRVIDLARALAAEPDVLLLDEMTAALPADLAETVMGLIAGQRETGRSVIFISHRLLEVKALCDRATVLRDGETVGIVDIGPGAEDHIVELMLGPATDDESAIHRRVVASAAGLPASVASAAGLPASVAAPVADAHPASDAEPTLVGEASVPAHVTVAPRLMARDLAADGKLSGVSFELRVGEVLGLVALEGQGQDELFGILSGARRASGGTLEVDGREVQFRHPADAIAAGLVLVPGDRVEGLLMQRSVRENIALPYTAPPRAWGPIAMRAEAARVRAAIARLQIDTRAQGEVRRLSGGNQQKVTVARWIAGGVRTLLCFDPTRGIDIRTKRQIYHLLRELAGAGAAILLYTSELEEVQLACDRAVVIFGGRVVEEMPADIADEAMLMRAAHGLARDTEIGAYVAAETAEAGA